MKCARITKTDHKKGEYGYQTELPVLDFVETYILDGKLPPGSDGETHIEHKIGRLAYVVAWIYQTMADNATPAVQKQILEMLHDCVGPKSKIEVFEKDEAS